MHFKKKNSGAQNRKNKKKIKIENEKLASTFEKWVSTSTSVSSSSLLKNSDVSVKIHNDLDNSPTVYESPDIPIDKHHKLNNPEPLNDTTIKKDTKLDESKLSKLTAISDKDKSNITESSNNMMEISSIEPILDISKSIDNVEPRLSKIIPVTQQHTIDYNNPPSWTHMTDGMRITLILHGPDQGKNIELRRIQTKDGRRFLPHWFKKHLPNSETIDRNWLIYIKMPYSVFLVACLNIDKLRYL